MEFQQWLGPLHMDWRTTMHANRLLANFPGMLINVLFLENCQKTISIHCFSPIHVDRSLWVSYLGDKSVQYLKEEKRIFPHGLENNHAWKWILDDFPGIIYMSAFLENCQNFICRLHCSPILVERAYPKDPQIVPYPLTTLKCSHAFKAFKALITSWTCADFFWLNDNLT